MKKAISILLPIFTCFLTGLTASYFQADSIHSWYPTLNKPLLTPPDFIFPIAWSLIYVCIGLSIGLVSMSGIREKRVLIKIFGMQLFLNFAWSILFFYFKSPLLGFIDILILDVAVATYIIRSYPIKKVSAFLFFPYLLWILFATYLNGYILLYN